MDDTSRVDERFIRVKTLRSVYPGLTDEQIARKHAMWRKSHVAVRYKHRNASEFTHFGFFSHQSEVDACLGNRDCQDTEVLFDDGMALPRKELELTKEKEMTWDNCPVTPTLLKLKSYPPEFYIELVKWSKLTGGITSAQRKSIKWFAYISEGDWGPKPAKQKYLLHIIQKAVDNGFPGIEGVDISEFLSKKKAPGEKKQEFKRYAVPNKAAIMQALFEKQKAKCMYCGKEKHEPNDLHLDHKIPVSVGGSNDLHNLQLLCGSCNSRKGNMQDDEFREKYKLPPSSQVTGPPKKVLLQSYFIKITRAA